MKRETYTPKTIRVLNKIYSNLCRLNQNFDELITLASQTNNHNDFNEADFANYLELQTTKSQRRADQKEKQRNYKNSKL